MTAEARNEMDGSETVESHHQDAKGLSEALAAARRSALAWKMCATFYRARILEMENENAALCEEVEELLMEAAAPSK
jgi:hypothetical protein